MQNGIFQQLIINFSKNSFKLSYKEKKRQQRLHKQKTQR